MTIPMWIGRTSMYEPNLLTYYVIVPILVFLLVPLVNIVIGLCVGRWLFCFAIVWDFHRNRPVFNNDDAAGFRSTSFQCRADDLHNTAFFFTPFSLGSKRFFFFIFLFFVEIIVVFLVPILALASTVNKKRQRKRIDETNEKKTNQIIQKLRYSLAFDMKCMRGAERSVFGMKHCDVVHWARRNTVNICVESSVELLAVICCIQKNSTLE